MILSKLLGVSTITTQQLQELIQREKPLILDVNPRRSWLKHRIPGSTNVDPAQYKEDILPPDKSAPVVFYCSDRSCGAALYAARRARKMGYTNALVLSDGIKGWLKAGLPFESDHEGA